MTEADLVVIGAGPAGMSAARAAADAGLSVVLLDEQRKAGGQIYRDVVRAAKVRADILGPDFHKGLELVHALRHANIHHITGATVWQIERNTRVAYTVEGAASFVTGKCLLIATGALERPIPVPGWTLPGAMTAGAAQILLKQSGMLVENAVLAGCGPLLYLVAAQMCRAGTPPQALVETQSTANILAAVLHHGMGAIQGWRQLAKGLGLLSELRSSGVKRFTGASAIAIEGSEHVEAIRFTARGRRQRVECSTVLLHHGVVANTQTARSIGVPHHWDELQRAFVPEKNKWGRTVHPQVYIAGDGAGIGGADAAAITGRIAALAIAGELGAITQAERDAAALPLRRDLRRELAARPFIDRAYPPYGGALSPADETIICRCEEVTAGDIRKYAKIGCRGPNQTKAFGRPGMGPCQGRYCGLTVTELLAAANGLSPQDTGYYRIRPPIKPVTLGELAGLAKQIEDEKETAQ
ncbi:NAD(P)/FAD-dependent oxidoreductase [Roseibium marinum]|uniref:NADPH-dependent 2,4-dienoyl-CoA reductase/sulfur reductase-like enzyme n=1 Tax=Roseibium marinum TaxID=281252 RepID=A0A2S3V249_9HYPH|nr:FAD/NAD(P)-binding oxidoreductase [Roseibium marinum]POF34054.1 NADPH-dependent 2,4-dienoyl-CoA reductase/sulfur reductase-like enzyme [Roseibium marinum]